MSEMASQIPGVSIVCQPFVEADQRTHQSSASLAVEGNPPFTGGFSSQRAGNAEMVSIWWHKTGESNYSSMPGEFHKTAPTKFLEKIIQKYMEPAWPINGQEIMEIQLILTKLQPLPDS